MKIPAHIIHALVAAVAPRDPERPYLYSIRYDAEHNMLAATNGHTLFYCHPNKRLSNDHILWPVPETHGHADHYHIDSGVITAVSPYGKRLKVTAFAPLEWFSMDILSRLPKPGTYTNAAPILNANYLAKVAECFPNQPVKLQSTAKALVVESVSRCPFTYHRALVVMQMRVQP